MVYAMQSALDFSMARLQRNLATSDWQVDRDPFRPSSVIAKERVPRGAFSDSVRPPISVGVLRTCDAESKGAAPSNRGETIHSSKTCARMQRSPCTLCLLC